MGELDRTFILTVLSSEQLISVEKFFALQMYSGVISSDLSLKLIYKLELETTTRKRSFAPVKANTNLYLNKKVGFHSCT